MRSSAKRKPAETTTASASRPVPSLRLSRRPSSIALEPRTATPSVTATRPSISSRTHGRAARAQDPAGRPRGAPAPGSAANAVGVQRQPVERRRAVAHDRVREAVDALLQAPTRPVGLAVGEPAQLRADDDLDVGPGAARERGGLEPALAAADDDHAAAAVRVVVLAVDRERRPRRPSNASNGEGACGNGVTPTATTTWRASASSPAAVVMRNTPPPRSSCATSDGSFSGTSVSRNQSA